MSGMLEGKKTYIGLLIVLTGMIIKDYVGDEEFHRLVADFFEVAGIVVAAYGRYTAKVPLSAKAADAVSVVRNNVQ
jgi:hypothetical protein